MNIKMNHVSYIYNLNQTIQYDALNDINAEVCENEFVAVIGHTGSGKSTLIQTLNALLIPTSGNVEVDEFIIQKKIKIKNIKQLRKKIGIVFQFPEYQLFEENVEKDILFGPKNFGMKSEELTNLASKVLKMVNLDDSFLEKSPFELSGGEKRRIAIAGILAFNPDVLIVDEPTAGLDPQSANKMMELFYDLYKNKKKTIILVTHQMNDVLKYATKVFALKKGKLEACMSPQALFQDEKILQDLQLEKPEILKLADEVKKKYPKFDINKVKDIPSFVATLKDVKKWEI